MKSNLFILITLLACSQFVFAQPEDHPHHEKHYSDVAPIETDEIKIEIIKPHSQLNFTQFNAKIYNKTDDYILIKKHALGFTSEEMGYGTKHPSEAVIFIEPGGDISRSFKVEGGIGFKVDALEITLDGFSRSPAEGKPVEAGEFKMKPDKNSLMMGPFAVTLKKWRYNQKELTADFKIRYRGESLGLVDESKIKIRKEDSVVLDNEDAKDKPFVVPPMKTRTVNAIKRFAKGEVGKGESVYVVWEGALTEASSTPFKVPGFSLIYDAEKTKKENK